MAFETSNNIVARLCGQLGIDERTYAIMQIWDRTLGPLAPFARLEGMKQRFLIVAVASSVHLQELTLRRREIIRLINQHFGGQKVVAGIQFHLKK